MSESIIKTNCFAFDKTTQKCRACNDLSCNNCKFYKKNIYDVKIETHKKRKVN